MTANLKINDVVQIDPAHDEVFGGAFMIVTEPKSWGAQGFVPMVMAAEGGTGRAFYRCKHEAMVLIGRAEWSDRDNEEEDA